MDMIKQDSIVWNILYQIGFYKKTLKYMDDLRDIVIHVLVVIKHATVDKVKCLFGRE